jgi:hypothetical protein
VGRDFENIERGTVKGFRVDNTALIF